MEWGNGELTNQILSWKFPLVWGIIQGKGQGNKEQLLDRTDIVEVYYLLISPDQLEEIVIR